MSAEARWNGITARSRPVTASGTRADPDRNPARVLSAIAVASIAAGAINIAAAQIGWGAVALVRAPRWWLALGAAGNLVAAATWVV